nr:zinc finger, CCHC-type [Tanacetum cinerariifolium]
MFRLNVVNDAIALAFMSTFELNDSIIWHTRLGHVHFKRMQDISKDGLILAFDIDIEKWFEVVSLPDPNLKTLGERGIECIFVGYAEHSKTFRFSSVLRPSLRIPNGTKDIGGSVVPEEMYVKPAFLNCELDEQVYMNQPHGLIVLGGPGKEFLSSRFSMKDMGEANVILSIRIKYESIGIAISHSHYIEKVLKKFNYFDYTPMSTHMDKIKKLTPNNGQAVSQLEYSRVISCLMYAITCTRHDIAFAVGKVSRYTSNLGTQH